jgi:PAS domain S-box-containing protein
MSDLSSAIHHILLVEDNPADARLVREHLNTGSGTCAFHVTHVSTLDQARDILQKSEFQAILLDLNLPGTNGLETLTRIRPANPGSPIVVLTGTEDEHLGVEAIKRGAQDYIPKSQMNSVLLPRVLLFAIEREKFDRERQASERTFRLFVEGATGLAFILLDVEGNIIHWNTGAQRLFGYTEEAAMHKHFSFLFLMEDQRNGRPESELRRAKNNEKGNDDNYLVRADGTPFWASGAITAVRDSQDNLRGFAKVVRDTTAQKETADKLAELNQTLEKRVHQRTIELVRYQARLRSMASDLTLMEQRERRRLATDLHDYLAQLLIACHFNFSQALSLTDTKSLLGVIQESNLLVNQAIEYTRTLVTQISPPCLYEFGLPAALEWLGSEMKKQGLIVEVHGEKLSVNLKEEQAILLYQSVRELLFNVLKHSGTQNAIVSLSIQANNLFNIEVADHGRGFIKGQEEREKDSANTFGLFSIRERMEALGGKTTITSDLGKGTRILLQIPLADIPIGHERPIKDSRPVRAPMEASDAHSPSKKIRVLLADDHKMVREGLCRILNAEMDMEIVGEAEDGQQALTLCHSLRPDVVVMDLHMPNVDGLKATRRIKQDYPDTAVLGLSVYDTPEIAQWFAEAGANAFMAKGKPADMLVNAIRQLRPQQPLS